MRGAIEPLRAPSVQIRAVLSRGIPEDTADRLDKTGLTCAFRAPFNEPPMHRYRSHTCGALRATDIGETVRVSGWCHRIRDHGGVLFIDLRDHYGTGAGRWQIPISRRFRTAETLRSEWVVKIDGRVRRARRYRKSRAANRRGRNLRNRYRSAGTGRGVADAGVRRPGISGGDQAQISIPRSPA